MRGKPAPFAVWLTGLPAAGKSAVAAALLRELKSRGVEAVALESDELRKVLSPAPRYDDAGRDAFYGSMLRLALRLLRHGTCVVFDATANRKRYRDRARASIERFVEVYVDTPLPVCERRDPKGIYRRAREGTARNVPGLSAEYEAPDAPELTIRGDLDPPARSAGRIVSLLDSLGWLAPE